MRRYQVEITEVRDSGWPPWLMGLAFVFGLLIVAGGMFGSHNTAPQSTPASTAAPASEPTGLTVQNTETAAQTEPASETTPPVDPAAQSGQADSQAAAPTVAEASPSLAAEAALPQPAANSGRTCRQTDSGLFCRSEGGYWSRADAEPEPATASVADAASSPQRCEAQTAAYRAARGDALSPADYHAFYERCLVAQGPRGTAGLY